MCAGLMNACCRCSASIRARSRASSNSSDNLFRSIAKVLSQLRVSCCSLHSRLTPNVSCEAAVTLPYQTPGPRDLEYSTAVPRPARWNLKRADLAEPCAAAIPAVELCPDLREPDKVLRQPPSFALSAPAARPPLPAFAGQKTGAAHTAAPCESGDGPGA